MRNEKISRSRFLRVRCSNCNNEQIIFNKASTIVSCLVCDKVLAEPRGGNAKVMTSVLEVVDSK